MLILVAEKIGGGGTPHIFKWFMGLSKSSDLNRKLDFEKGN